MNILNTFEDRVSAIFDTTSQGFRAPFSFKKLAKQAVREMDKETFVVNGVDTAPALFTILVSPVDDVAIRPFYTKLTTEIRQLVEAQAERKRAVFVGEPLVRFMVDPSLRSGKFSVFAENVDARTLKRLRAEEESYLDDITGGRNRKQGRASQGNAGQGQGAKQPARQRVRRPAPRTQGVEGVDVPPTARRDGAAQPPSDAAARAAAAVQLATSTDNDPAYAPAQEQVAGLSGGAVSMLPAAGGTKFGEYTPRGRNVANKQGAASFGRFTGAAGAAAAALRANETMPVVESVEQFPAYVNPHPGEKPSDKEAEQARAEEAKGSTEGSLLAGTKDPVATGLSPYDEALIEGDPLSRVARNARRRPAPLADPYGDMAAALQPDAAEDNVDPQPSYEPELASSATAYDHGATYDPEPSYDSRDSYEAEPLPEWPLEEPAYDPEPTEPQIEAYDPTDNNPLTRHVEPTPVGHRSPVTGYEPGFTPTCMLMDRQSGRTYTASAPSTVLGRERNEGGIVLADPNVSRAHAELEWDGGAWHIIDLNSTNGTLVNNVDVSDCVLRDGDMVTLGLINLEFREVFS